MQNIINESWKIIPPFWPLKNLIAVNPLQGLEDLSFEEALIKGSEHFELEQLPEPMEEVNRETIKWLQVFFDEGQSTISMPNREKGLFHSWRELAIFDSKLKIVEILPDSSKEAIKLYLSLLKIKKSEYKNFLSLLLTTLPGWASYVKYLTEWNSSKQYPVSQEDYLAVRIIITYLLWPQAKELFNLNSSTTEKKNPLVEIEKNEKIFRSNLLNQISTHKLSKYENPEAQLVFCIDVRSEPFRIALEKVGNYETFGFAGFFGVPVEIENSITGDKYASCPVLLKPKHKVSEYPHCSHKEHNKYSLSKSLKLFYQSLKYNFTTAFALVETIGIYTGIWMFIRSFAPNFASNIFKTIRADDNHIPSLDNINFADQCVYAESALRMIGVTKKFSPLVVLCGHGSTTENNAFATSLDCGACGGRHGASNARILAAILNKIEVRKALEQKQIFIPEETIFLAAEHNTTNDEVKLYNYPNINEVDQLIKDLKKAGNINSQIRCKQMSVEYTNKQTKIRSIDWTQPRPEWGLARNAAFIVAPRSLTKNINLEGRCFLHSYDYLKDSDGSSLTVILTAPMIVAQWINAQYLFSTLNNISYGAGSKITKNITGKIGVMQGNASDLMTGLPLQSVYISDNQPYHELQRLMTLVYAPKSMIDKIISNQDILKKLFINGWVKLSCLDPTDNITYLLNRDLEWEQA